MTIADLLPPPPAGPPTAVERDRIARTMRKGLYAQVLAEQRAVARRRRAAAVGAPGLVMACAGAALALIVVATATPPSPPVDSARPVVASADAVQVLQTASRHAATGEPLAPAADQFVYVRSVAVTNEGAAGGPVDVGDQHNREIWLSQQPGATRDGGLLREFGQDWPLSSGTGSSAGVRRPTYAYLASLPRDPDELLDELASQLPPWEDARGTDQVLFDTIVDLVSEGLAPPRTTAALYGALTRIPGVQIDQEARDLLGRPGVGITRSDGVFADRTVLIVDPSSGQTIGARYMMSGPDGDEVFGATAVVARGVADEAGEAPESARDRASAAHEPA